MPLLLINTADAAVDDATGNGDDGIPLSQGLTGVY